mmetsp:Transcript_8954/g.19755  ORF Transcript_8954/g.19755 Transcript_8954/m.19755 type:complete len:264 (-) Transcript_8954:216-1007(-)
MGSINIPLSVPMSLSRICPFLLEFLSQHFPSDHSSLPSSKTPRTSAESVAISFRLATTVRGCVTLTIAEPLQKESPFSVPTRKTRSKRLLPSPIHRRPWNVPSFSREGSMKKPPIETCSETSGEASGVAAGAGKRTDFISGIAIFCSAPEPLLISSRSSLSTASSLTASSLTASALTGTLTEAQPKLQGHKLHLPHPSSPSMISSKRPLTTRSDLRSRQDSLYLGQLSLWWLPTLVTSSIPPTNSQWAQVPHLVRDRLGHRLP